MRFYLIAVGERVPQWVAAGYEEFARRLPANTPLRLIEVATSKRGKGVDLRRAVADEGERTLSQIPRGAHVIALDEHGLSWSTSELAGQIEKWRHLGGDVAFLIGGPDGLAAVCRERAARLWSLSALTLPHALVRVLVAEQLYRATSLIAGHPYHRE